MPIDFSPYHAVLLDLDGTVYHEDNALPGAIQLINRLQRDGKPFACLSNSTNSPQRTAERLKQMGSIVAPERIYTAAAATCDYVLERFASADHMAAIADVPPMPPRKPKIFNLATESVHEMLDGKVEWVNNASEACDAVVSGAPSNEYATEERQRTALILLRKGCSLIGICADRVYPSPRGIEFGSGAQTQMLSYAANVKPVFCGKPEQIFFYELCRRLELNPAWCLLIGDNLEADVIGAKRMKMRTILTLTGVTRREELQRVPPELQPDLVVEDLRELL